MTGVITILLAGTGTGPFYLYSDVDGFVMPFASAISKAALLSGYPTDQIPDGTTMIRVQSLNDVCNNHVDITIPVSTTTTTTSIGVPSLAACDIIVGAEVPLRYAVSPYVNEELTIPSYGYGIDIANTSNKFWEQYEPYSDGGTGWITEVWEYDITYTPFTAVFNRIIYFPYALGQGLCAIDDTTLIVTYNFDRYPYLYPTKVYEADITGLSPILTYKFDLEWTGAPDHINMIVSGDYLLTNGVNPKFIVTTTDDYNGGTYIYQYDWNTGTQEIKKDISIETSNPFGLAVQSGHLYLFEAFTDTIVYEVALTSPYDLTVVDTLIGSWVSGATQQPSCIDVELVITTTTTTTVTPTTTTTTTLAPEDYTYYEAEYYSCVAETCTGGPVATWVYNVDPTLVINNYYYDSVTDKSYYLLSSGQTYAAYVLAGSPPAVETDTAFAGIAYVTCTCLPLAPP